MCLHLHVDDFFFGSLCLGSLSRNANLDKSHKISGDSISHFLGLNIGELLYQSLVRFEISCEGIWIQLKKPFGCVLDVLRSYATQLSFTAYKYQVRRALEYEYKAYGLSLQLGAAIPLCCMNNSLRRMKRLRTPREI